GSTDARGLHHLVYEIVDNSIDEALSGYADHITVTLAKDGSAIVTDNGRGMPIGKHTSGKPTVEVILTVLHAGGKPGKPKTKAFKSKNTGTKIQFYPDAEIFGNIKFDPSTIREHLRESA